MPIDEDRNVIGPGKYIGLCLTLAGASFDDIVKVVGFFSDLDQVQYQAAVRRRLLPQGRYPVAPILQAAKVGLGAGHLDGD